jgi:hypothetical protein
MTGKVFITNSILFSRFVGEQISFQVLNDSQFFF